MATDPKTAGASRLPGVPVKIGGRVLVMPALPAGEMLEHLRIIAPLIERAKKDDAATPLLEAELAMIHSALVRNYPELRVDELEDVLGPFQVVELFDRLCRYSGTAGGAMVQAAQQSKARA